MLYDMNVTAPFVLALASAGALLSTASAAPVHPAPVQGGSYSLVWEDNFDGTTLDASKWTPMIGNGCPNLCGWGNNELQYYRAENATVGGGLLTITARRQFFGGSQYTSARLRSLNKADFTYGRFEMSAKLPAGQGLWPAFWMLPSDSVYGTWAASGEIDIMEAVGQNESRVLGTIHYGGTFPNNTFSGESYTLPNGNLTDSFHTYAIEWEPTVIRWYIDGIQYATRTNWFSSNGTYPAPFNERFHMLLNLAVGGNLPGPPNQATPFPATYEIDYVRVYQQDVPDPEDCITVFDNMDHGDLAANDYFEFNGGGSGSISPNFTDLPPSQGGVASLGASWSNSGVAGYLGGFGRTRTIDLAASTHFEMWINPDAGQEFVIEINLQDDDNGDNEIPASPDGQDDEFQYELLIGPPGSPVVSGGGWQKVSIPLADFYDDNTFLTGGNGVLDLRSTGLGGNGQLINIVMTLVTLNGQPASFRTDHWSFVRPESEIAGRVWDDLNSDGLSNGEPGLPGVTVELFDTSQNAVIATDTTSAQGAYSFPNQVRGSYEVRVDSATLPVGVTATFDPDGIATPGEFMLELACDELIDGQDFGFEPDMLGERICSPAVNNSTGEYGRMTAGGTAVVGSNDLSLTASRLPVGSLGYFLVSPGSGFIPNPGGSFGNLCLAPPFGRYVQFAGPVGPDGTISIDVDVTQLPQPNGAVAAQPGETWYFQMWHRDSVIGLVTSNFSEGLGITFE
jgi:beta-glucanase (GH16 family)